MRLTGKSISPRVLAAEYAVRGRVLSRAWQLQSAGRLSKPVYCNIGNPHSFDQRPLSFPRRVLALTNVPELVDLVGAAGKTCMPEDVVARAKRYLDGIPGGTGAYSQSQGIEIVREEVAEFVRQRDYATSSTVYPPNKNDVFLTDGASPAVQRMLQMLIRDGNDGIMIPTPQYPLYSASITLFGGTAAPYYLDEKAGWSMDTGILEKALKEAQKKGVCVRAMVVINPGNPTGQCLARKSQEAIVSFCHRNNLVLLADEVYQENIWNPTLPFVSFRKIATDMGVLTPTPSGNEDASTGLQLASFHSVSKGFFGECGRRGGYAELTGFSKEVKAQYYKIASVNLCANLDGQVMVGLMVNPPKKGDPSFAQFEEEKHTILSTLQRKAKKVGQILNGVPNMSCNQVDGALYAFPRVYLPQGAIREAEQKKLPVDEFYCLELLEETGIVVVPGSGFGQEEGSFHFRTTILPRENELDSVLGKISAFHEKFWKKYNN